MKKNITLICFLFTIILARAQQTINDIKKSSRYYWGEGTGKNLTQADKNALRDLITQISVNIQTQFKNTMVEENGNFKEYTESITNTYSGATLDRAERKVDESKKDQVTVLRYIPKEKMEEIFTDRKRKIFEYIKTAEEAEKEVRISDALKYYYWALALLRSHPDCNKINASINGKPEALILTALPDKINTIFTQLKVEISDIVDKKEEKNIILSIKYQDKPVQNYDFTYWTGDTWTNLNSAKDGIGTADFFGETSGSFSDLRLRTEYIYLENSKVDNEIASVLENNNTPNFKFAELKIPLKKTVKKEKEIPAEINENITKISKKEEVLITEISPEINSNMTLIKKSIENKSALTVKHLFTEEGFKIFEKLINYGNPTIIPQKNKMQQINLGEKTIIRSLPMTFAFKKSNKKFVEEIVFTQDKDGKICNVAFGLSDIALNGILGQSQEFATINEKFQLVQFMEDYKTAYNLGRIDYLEQIFSDNALIIVGNILKQQENMPMDAMKVNLNQKNINYIKLSKKEFLDKLRTVFKNNEAVNIRFDENTIKKQRKDGKVFGIQIAQNYYSTNYADKGYLFLMIDLEDLSNPKIYVRTWQPEKNPDGSIFGISDFHF